MKEKKTDKVLLGRYHNPENPGSNGGVQWFANENGISIKRAKRTLGKTFRLHVTQITSAQVSVTPCKSV